LHFAVQQRAQARAEAAGVHRLDVLERQVFFQPEGHVEMAAGAHADRDLHVLQVLGLADLRLRADEDRPGRDAVAVADEAAHAGAGVGDRAPDAGALDQAAVLRLGIGLVLGALQVVRALPARLRAAEGLDVPLDLDAFGGEEPFFLGDEIVEAHTLGRDADFTHSFLLAWRTRQLYPWERAGLPCHQIGHRRAFPQEEYQWPESSSARCRNR